MGNCACGLVKRKSSQQKQKHLIMDTEQDEDVVSALTPKQIHCLSLIYEDLANRSQSKTLNIEAFKDFFHLNSILGQPLFNRFVKQKPYEISKKEFIDTFNAIFNGNEQQLLRLTFDVLDTNNSKSLSYYQLINVFLSSVSECIKCILKDDKFIDTLSVKQISSFILESRENKERYQAKYYESGKLQSKEQQNMIDKFLIKLPKATQQKYLQNKENSKKLLKNYVNYKTCSPTIIIKYVDYLFESLGINKWNDQIDFKKFQILVAQNPGIFAYFFNGFHEHIWRHENDIPSYKEIVPIISDTCLQKSQQMQRQVYISLIKNSILVFEDQRMVQPLQIKNMEGLNVLPIEGKQGYGFKVYHEDGFYQSFEFYFEDSVKQIEWLRSLKQYIVRNVEDRYKIKQKVSNGKTNQVCLCQELKTNQKYAIKIKKQRSTQTKDLYTQPQIISLCNHKNIGRLIKAFKSKKSLYMIMQQYEPQTLKSYLKSSQKSLKQPQIKTIIQQIINALSMLHSLGIIHRNVNAQNILITKQGQSYVPKLVGFSHAVYKISLNYGNALRDCVNSGGVAYMAPEILRKERYDERIDVYAVGVCIWYMVAGELPVSGKEVQFEGLAWERVSMKIRDLLGKMMCKKEKRISCEQVLKHQWFWD